MELVVANYSGKVLDYLSAHLKVESDWLPCDNWDGLGSYGKPVVWTGPLMSIQDVGSLGPGEERREIEFVLAFHDEEPELGRWDIDYDFATSPPAGSAGIETARQTATAPLEPARTASRFRPDETCAGKDVGASCWMVLSNHPGCYIWNRNLAGDDETVVWSGDCSAGGPRGRLDNVELHRRQRQAGDLLQH